LNKQVRTDAHEGANDDDGNDNAGDLTSCKDNMISITGGAVVSLCAIAHAAPTSSIVTINCWGRAVTVLRRSVGSRWVIGNPASAIGTRADTTVADSGRQAGIAGVCCGKCATQRRLSSPKGDIHITAGEGRAVDEGLGSVKRYRR